MQRKIFALQNSPHGIAGAATRKRRPCRARVPAWRASVLHPRAATADHGAEGERVLRLLLAELPLKSAVRLAAEISSAPRNALYEAGLRMRDETND